MTIDDVLDHALEYDCDISITAYPIGKCLITMTKDKHTMSSLITREGMQSINIETLLIGFFQK